MASGSRLDGAALVRAFEALPLSAFDRGFADDPVRLLPSLFGPETFVEPFIHCTHLGAWVGGWTVITALPDGQGTFAFVLREYQSDSPEWARMSRGKRIDVLTKAIRSNVDEVWVAKDLDTLIFAMIEDLNDPMRGFVFDFHRFGALNDHAEPWVLQHALGLLAGEEAAAVPFLASLKFESRDLDYAMMLVERASNVVANFPLKDETATVTVEAVERLYGKTLTGPQLEFLGIPGALMTFPRESWPVEAEAMAKAAYDADMFPPDYSNYRHRMNRQVAGAGTRSGS